jgi:hypothetical protein
MSGISFNFPTGLEFAPRNVLPSNGSSLTDQSGAHRCASTTQFGHWRSVLFILLLCFLPVTLFGAITPATLISPAAGSVLPGSSATFSWTPGSGVTAYALWVGVTGVGQRDIFDSGIISMTSITVPTLPTNGATVYVAVYSEVNGVWTPINYTFTAAASKVVPAALSSPKAGSVLSGSSVTFSWTPGSGVTAYALWVGVTGVGQRDIFDSGIISLTSITVPKLPTNGATVYVAVYSEINGVWTPINYTFTAAKTLAPATFSSPAAGSVLPGSSVTFSWAPVAGVTTYQLWLGLNGQGSSSLYNSGHITANSVTVTGLPTKGAPLYATLYSDINGTMTPVYATYTEAGTAVPAALSAVSCSSSSMTGSGTDTCTVTLSAAAPSGGLSVKLASSNSAVTVPATVTVPANATSATFAATVSSVSTAQAATLTATTGSVSKSFALQLNAASVLLGINATSVAFGDVAVNTASTQSITLTATGTAPVTISAATLTGTGFTMPGATLPMTLNPGQAVSLSVEFDPAAPGAVTGQLTISSNCSGGSKAVIALSGTGATYQVGLTWQAPATSTDPVAGYNIYRSPSGSSTYELVNSSVETQTAYTDNTVQTGQTYDYVVESVDASGNESAPSTMASVVIP